MNTEIGPISATKKSVLGLFSKKMQTLGMIVLAIMPIPIVVDVIRRAIVGRSVPGIIETEEFMLVLIVYLSLAITQWQKGQISIDLVYGKLSARRQMAIDCFNSLMCFILAGLLTWRLTANAIDKLPERSFSLFIPISIFVFIAAFGTLVLALVLFVQVLESGSRMLKNGMVMGLFVVVIVSIFLYVAPFLIKLLPWSLGGISLGAFGFCFLFVLILLNMPIGYAMAIAGFLGLLITNRTVWGALGTFGTAPYATTASFILAVAPLFIVMGELAYRAGISDDLFDTAHKWLGRLPGGLAISAVAGCAGFAAVSGDSMSTAVTMGTVSLPEMEKKKYSPSLATGCLAAGGTLGILIPPSVGFIFYAIVTEVSIGKLFMAGILPGILLAGLFMIYIYIIARMKPEVAPRGESTTFREKLLALKGVIGMLVLFVLVLGGIIGGIFSPTEGGAIGAAGAFVMALVKRRLTRRIFRAALEDTVTITCKLLLILIGVGILSYFLAATRLPSELADFVSGLQVSRYMVFTIVILLFIFLGCIMNVIPMLLLTLPAIFPSIEALGFDPVWFGVISVLVMEMGQITPPIGVNVFAISSIAKNVPMATIFKGIFPFFICMVVCTFILVLFPQIALYLPNLLFN
ncbi:MAG: TRAP transporter large permease subunit [Thermodesulfobacteriota bacterium]